MIISTTVVATSVAEVSVAVGAATASMVEVAVTAVISVAHTMSCSVARTEVAAVIPASATIHPPTVTATIDIPEVGTAEEEVVTMRIAGIDAEVPVASLPVQGAIEITCCQVGLILPVEQYVAQVEISLCPVDTIEVCLGVYAHQVVEVDFICCLILLFGKIELIGHLVGQEQCLLASLLITHSIGRHREGEQCCKGNQ